MISKAPETPAIAAWDVKPKPRSSSYPEPFSNRIAGREKRPLGDHFGLKNFGVNLTRLTPGTESALLHRHSKQDEFVYILEGHPTLATETGEQALSPGVCVGFPANGDAHHLVNRTDTDVLYLDIGDRPPGDEGTYPNDDLAAHLDPNGRWIFTHKNGEPYKTRRTEITTNLIPADLAQVCDPEVGHCISG